MEYFKLINAISENEDAWDLGKVKNYSEFEIKKMNTSEWNSIIDKPIEIEIDEEFGNNEIDFNLSETGIQIVSENFKNLIRAEEAEFYPVEFTNTKPLQKYFALKINQFYDCVDESKSEFEYWSNTEVEMVSIRKNKYKSLNRFSIDSSKCDGARIFRLLKYFPNIIVTEELKQMFIQHQISGLNFEKIG